MSGQREAQVEKTSAVPAWKFRFFAIWTGEAASLLGSAVVQFALIWWLTETTGSARVLALASLVGLAPSIVLGPFVGVLVDRWNRRWIMILADAVVALAALWLALLFWRGAVQTWHVYVLMFVRSLAGSFHWTAMQTSTSLMVPERHLTRVAGLNQALNGALTVMGPPLGALSLQLLRFEQVMLLDVGTALVAILPLLWLRVPQPARSDGAQSSVWTDMREGMRYILEWPGLVQLIIGALIFKLALTPAMSLLPLLVSRHFRGGAAQLSLLESSLGLGLLLGGLLLGIWGGFKRRVYTALLGLGLAGLAYMLMGLLPASAFWAAVVLGYAAGMGIPLVDGPFLAILQSNVAPELQARVFTLLMSLLSLSSPIGLVMAGPIADTFSLQVWYVAAGALMLATAAAFYFMPAIRNIEQNGNSRQPVAP
jgi:DHA3 family macrolide efflux protein-like MFS transporter